MSKNLNNLMRYLQKKSLERNLKTQEFMARDNYFIGMVSRLLAEGISKGESSGDSDVDESVSKQVQDLLAEHHKVYCDHMSRMLAATDQLIEKMEDIERKQEEER